MTAGTQLATVRIYDRDDKLLAQVPMPKRGPGDPPRSTIFCGRKFVEGTGGSSSYYRENEFREVAPD